MLLFSLRCADYSRNYFKMQGEEFVKRDTPGTGIHRYSQDINKFMICFRKNPHLLKEGIFSKAFTPPDVPIKLIKY